MRQRHFEIQCKSFKCKLSRLILCSAKAIDKSILLLYNSKYKDCDENALPAAFHREAAKAENR